MVDTEDQEEILLTIPQVAEQLCKSRPTIYRFVQENLIEAVEVDGQIRIRQSAISRFLGG